MVENSSSSNTNAKASQSKSAKSASAASQSSNSMSLKVVEKKSPSLEKRNLRDLQQQLIQLREELKREKEEKFEAMEELVLLRKDVSRNAANGSKPKVEILQREAEKAKQSERKMLESLVSQTKQLEQTKISVEEAKLEIKSLKERIKSLESSSTSGSQSSRNLGKHLLQYGFAGLAHADDEIVVLRNNLRLATEAEEKIRKAMDNLAIALKEVTTEANQVKERLLITQSELERVRSEAESLKSLLNKTEDESERLKVEMEESATIWNAKESGFINCIKMSEEEITKVTAENDKLFGSQRVIREENAKLRDMLKHTVAEASDVKQALEISGKENAQLKGILCEKDNNLRSIKQEYDCLKVSEAAATDSVNELKGLLAATSIVDSNNNSSVPENEAFIDSNDSRSNKVLTKFSSERWNGNSPRFRAGRRHSIGEAGKFPMAASPKPKDRMLASLSNISHARAASSVVGDTDTLTLDDFNHMDAAQSEFGEQTLSKQKRKKNLLRRFGEMLKRTSVHKQI